MILWCGSSAWRSPCSTFVREIVVWRTNLEVTPALETIGMEGEGGTIAVGAEHAELHPVRIAQRSEEHTSELQSLMRISYAVFCLTKKKKKKKTTLHKMT